MPAIAQPLGQPMIADSIVPGPPAKDGVKPMGGNMTRPRAADDFAAIRARIEELRRQRAQAARDDAVEPYRPPGTKSPAPIDEQELIRRFGDRGRFSR
jgi:hypothetical protein